VLDYSFENRLDIAMQEGSKAQENEYWDEVKFLTSKRDQIWQYMKPEIYCIFWYLSLSNLFVPESQYQEEIERI
jgi:hypothetical protein